MCDPFFFSICFENEESQNSVAQLHLDKASRGAGGTDSWDASRSLTVMAGGRRGVLRLLTIALSCRPRGYKTESEWGATRVAIVFLGVLFPRRRPAATHCSVDAAAIRSSELRHPRIAQVKWGEMCVFRFLVSKSVSSS